MIQVRTLRGHEKDIVSVAVLRETGGADINWENPSHPVVVSLSSDGCVKAWDVIQVGGAILIILFEGERRKW